MTTILDPTDERTPVPSLSGPAAATPARLAARRSPHPSFCLQGLLRLSLSPFLPLPSQSWCTRFFLGKIEKYKLLIVFRRWPEA